MAKAATTLLKEVGKPRNSHTIDIDALRTLKAWLAQDDAERAKIVGELAAELDKIRTSKDWNEFKDSAWHIHRRFNDMIAIARVLDRLIRARLPLTEAALLRLVRFSTVRCDYSVLRLIAQLEHYGKTHVISDELRAALVALSEFYPSSRFAKERARIGWLTSPMQAERVKR